MGKLSRSKGARFERRIARWLSLILGRDVMRQTDEPQQGNRGDVRVSLSPSTNLVIQAKHQKRPSVWRAMAEAEEACRSKGDFPVACVRRHGGDDLVVMRPRDFSRLMACLDHARSDWSDIPSETW